MRREALDRPVHHVAGQHDEIGGEVLRELHYALDVAAADGVANVEIADLRDAKAFEIGMQAFDRDVHVHHLRPAQRDQRADHHRQH